MDVEFCDLTYTITRPFWPPKRRGPGKRILRSVSGRFKPGDLSAIIGPSGAGKTSLMDILAGVRTKGVKGSLLSNGEPRDEKTFGNNSCYLMQEDLLQPLITLRELMEFAAILKLPAATTKQQRLTKISEIIETLNLRGCEETLTELLSGGQRKRLSIGLELINNPPVLFLDEPTSGLDNVAAMQCVRLLRTLAHEGRTIVCSIHQPSALLFQLFDTVYALSQGLCVYQGPTADLVSFLDAAGLSCPVTHNLADFVIETTDGMDPTNIQVLSKAIANGKTIWKGCSNIASNGSVYEKSITNGKENSVDRDSLCLELPKSSVKSQCNYNYDLRISSLRQFGHLFNRMFLQIMRNRTGLWVQLFHHILCGLMIGTMFFDKADDGGHIFLHLKCAISIVVVQAYTHVFVPILTYPTAMKLLKREYINRWYKFGPYYFAQNLVGIPTKVFFSMIFLTIVYFMWGQPTEALRFFYFCLTGVLVGIVAEGLGFVIGSTFSITNGTAVGPASMVALLALAIYGFDFARSVPTWLDVVMQLSFIRLGLVGVVVTMFGLDREPLACPDNIHGYCHFQDPKVNLYWGGMDHAKMYELNLKFVGLFLAFRGLFFFTLKRRLMT